jgi:subtilisin family serine protease
MDQRRRSRALTALIASLALTGAAAAPARAASDPMLGDQWALNDPAATGAKQAWTQSLGAGVIVAVLDSGVQLDHPDLAQNLWTNPGEIPGNGIDDDHDGYVDDVHGANITQRNGNVADDNGHGTHVAGIVAAEQGNGIGGSGIAPRAKIMVVKVLDANAHGDSSQLALGIRYAVDEGARILNVSINGDGTSPDLNAAVAYAGQHGATIVASAGNNGRDLDVTPSYPVSLTDPAILGVTATEQGGGLLSIADRGLRTIDLAAPGDHILSTTLGSDYAWREGTSMAAPFVSGALALLASARPDLPQPLLRYALERSASRPSLLSGLVGYGNLDVGAAMHLILPGALWRSATSDEVVRLAVTASRRVRAGSSATVRWTARGATRVAHWRVLLDGHRVRTLPEGQRRLRARILRPGTHRWKVVGIDADGRRLAVEARRFKALSGV